MTSEPLRLHPPTADAAASNPAPEGRAASGLVVEPLLLRAGEAAALCGVSVATWWRWHAAGRCPAPVKVGGSVRWRRGQLSAWIEAGCPDRRTWEALQSAQKNGRG